MHISIMSPKLVFEFSTYSTNSVRKYKQVLGKSSKMQGDVYRFAPSPTGFLHVGGARTAIFNWLAAKSENGRFLLRIEDTDAERSTQASVEQILSSLGWLGITWDGEPVFQSRRSDRHREVAMQLVGKGLAYPCFCDRNETRPGKSDSDKSYNLYDGRCRTLSEQDIKKRQADGESYVIRLKVNAGITAYTDGIHGEISVSNEEIGDFVILRSDGSPIYQLAVVVDDNDMGVSHVLRGDDHISNTPKQILIYQALNWKIPRFSHLPLILGPDKVRLSKRHGASSVEEFRDQGILSEALFNYLCLLGWAPGDDREIIDRTEITRIFSLTRVNKADAVFDSQKLLWMNGKYIADAGDEQLLNVLNGHLDGKRQQKIHDNRAEFAELLKLSRPRSRTVLELTENIEFYFSDPATYDPTGVEKYFQHGDGQKLLQELYNLLTETDNYSIENLEVIIRACAQKMEIGAGKLIHPLRLALTGKTASPGIFEVIHLLGKETTLSRIKKATEFIQDNSTVQ